MSQITPKVPWYIAGLAFECTECGRCCAGPEEGYIWATDEEIDAIAKYLKITPEQMRAKYIRRVGRRFSIIEAANNDCFFLTPLKNGKRGCRIYPVRPRQCRTWPFWASNIASPEAWAIAGMRCPGINRGGLFGVDEINERAGTTRE